MAGKGRQYMELGLWKQKGLVESRRKGWKQCWNKQIHHRVLHVQQESVVGLKQEAECAVYWMPHMTRRDGRGNELREVTISLGAASALSCVPSIASGPFVLYLSVRWWDS